MRIDNDSFFFYRSIPESVRSNNDIFGIYKANTIVTNSIEVQFLHEQGVKTNKYEILQSLTAFLQLELFLS